MRPNQLQFDRYVLDLDRGCLLHDGSEIALRPKTFGVLRYLIENSGRLVAKDELFAAVWPNLIVTDDALVQSIGELRRALGDDGPRLIKTIPRRGYRFESDVSAAGAGAGVPADAPPAGAMPADVSAPLPRGRLRVGIFAALSLALLLAAGMLWRGIGTEKPQTAAKAAIAVLPFRNQSGDASREYFADGLSQDIISALGRFPELTVMSWNAVAPYKGKAASPEAIAERLVVNYQVEGSVLRTGERVRVAAQLVNSGGRVLWSARFDEALADLFTLQEQITSEIAGALAIRVTQIEQQRVFAKPTENLEAYDYVLRARPALQRPTRAGNVEARALLRRAIEVDPGFAAAYAALAENYHVAVSMGWAESPTEFLGRAEEMANKALSLDSAQVRAHVILGRIHTFYQRYEQASVELERAIALNPNDAHALAGRGNVLMWLGRTDAAIEALERAQRIDPELNAIDRFALSLSYYLKRRYDAAIEQAERNLRDTTDARFSRVVLAAAYAQHNRADDAARVATVIRRTDPTFDPQTFGGKFLNPTDLQHLRDGFRKAGLLIEAGAGPVK